MSSAYDSELPPHPSTVAGNTGAGVVVSTTYGPDFVVGGAFPDMIIVSSDCNYFYVHHERLVHYSANAFSGLLSLPSPFVPLPETSTVLNVVLHVVYGIPCVYLGTPIQTVEDSLDALVKYGISLKALAAPQQPIYSLLLAHAPYSPIEVYALAGQHDLEEAAVTISAHLLSYDSSQLSDELAVKMGSVYLWRLLDLHLVRTNALKRIVLRPPTMHLVTATCNFAAQGRLTNAWAFAAAQLAWEGSPSTSTHALQSAFGKVSAGITCQNCMGTLQSRIQEVIQQWSAVKRTI